MKKLVPASQPFFGQSGKIGCDRSNELEQDVSNIAEVGAATVDDIINVGVLF